MRRLASRLIVVALLSGSAALAGPCKDAKGKFIKCPPSHVTKGKDGRCRVAAGPSKGKFTKC